MTMIHDQHLHLLLEFIRLSLLIPHLILGTTLKDGPDVVNLLGKFLTNHIAEVVGLLQ